MAKAVLGRIAKALGERKEPLILVTPGTMVAWHRAGFRLYWRWVSRAKRLGGRRPIREEIRTLLFRMVEETPTWGAPRLLKLGLAVSEATVSRWFRQAPRNS